MHKAGQKLKDDCKKGIVQQFVKCASAEKDCQNTSAFIEETFSDQYGGLEVTIAKEPTRVKRGYVNRYRCRTECNPNNCRYGELFKFL